MSFIEIRFAESLNKVLAHSRRTFSRPGTRAGAGRLAQAQSRPRACRVRIAVAERLGDTRRRRAVRSPAPGTPRASTCHFRGAASALPPPTRGSSPWSPALPAPSIYIAGPHRPILGSAGRSSPLAAPPRAAWPRQRGHRARSRRHRHGLCGASGAEPQAGGQQLVSNGDRKNAGPHRGPCLSSRAGPMEKGRGGLELGAASQPLALAGPTALPSRGHAAGSWLHSSAQQSLPSPDQFCSARSLFPL